MRRAVFLAKTRDDFAWVMAYTADREGLPYAEKFVAGLRAHCHKFASQAAHGVSRSELREGMRCIPYRDYVIFWRYVGERCEIVAVLHGNYDVISFFSG